MLGSNKRIGFIGFGHIGKDVKEMIDEDSNNGMEVVFVSDINPESLKGVKKDLILEDISRFEEREPDLIVEMAHPDITRKMANSILKKCDYMFLSTTVIADKGLDKELIRITGEYGTRAIMPHGGAIGIDAIIENRDVLETLNVTMKKPPQNIDFKSSGIDPLKINKETVIYQGPTRGICPLFPRNVNTIATIAYAGIGLDKTNATLVVNPDWDTATVRIEAKGRGVEIYLERIEGITGVTGSSTPTAIYNSIQMVASQNPGIHIR